MHNNQQHTGNGPVFFQSENSTRGAPIPYIQQASGLGMRSDGVSMCARRNGPRLLCNSASMMPQLAGQWPDAFGFFLFFCCFSFLNFVASTVAPWCLGHDVGGWTQRGGKRTTFVECLT